MNVSAKADENESLDGLLERRVVQFQRVSEERGFQQNIYLFVANGVWSFLARLKRLKELKLE